MARKKVVTVEELAKQLYEEDAYEENLPVLERILSLFLEQYKDTKVIPSEEFFDKTLSFDFSEDELDKIYNYFHSRGYEIEDQKDSDAELDISDEEVLKLESQLDDDMDSYDEDDEFDEEREDLEGIDTIDEAQIY